MRLGDLVPPLAEPPVQGVAVAPVDLDVHALSLQAGCHPLHQDRSVDEAEDAVAHAHGGEQLTAVFGLRMDRGQADALPRDRQVFRVRAHDDAVPVGGHHAGHLEAVVHELAVRLVAHEVDRPADFAAAGFEHDSEIPNGGLRIHPAGRVVRRIDQERCGPRRDRPSQGVEIQVEVRPRRHRFQSAAVIGRIGPVVDEVRRADHDLVARIEKALERHVHGPGGPAGHDHVPPLDTHPLLLAQICRSGFPRLVQTGIGHVAVLARKLGLNGLEQGLAKTLRRLEPGVAEGEVVHHGTPTTQCLRLLEHPADPRRGGDLLGHLS